MFNPFKKREEFPEKKRAIPVEIPVETIKAEINNEKILALAKQVAEQEIVIRRLLELVIMDIEHKDYSKHILPQIHKVKNLLDKVK